VTAALWWVSGAEAAEPDGTRVDVRIGEYASLTGSLATFGVSTDEGLRLAIDEANAAGALPGRRLVLEVVDDGGTRDGAAAAVERLAASGVAVVVGEVVSQLSLAGGEVAQRLGVPMVSPASTVAGLTALGDRVFRVCAPDVHQGHAAAAFARGELDARAAVVVWDADAPYSRALEAAFTERFRALGGERVTSVPFRAGDTDLRAELKAVARARPDVVYVPTAYPDAAAIATAARSRGLRAPLLGSDGWDSATLVETAGSAVDGAYYVNHFAADDPRPEVAAFVAAYQRAYGRPPDVLAALGYDAGLVVVDALRRAPSTDGDALGRALSETHLPAAVTGPFTVGPDHDARKSMVVVQLRAGQPVWVASVPAD
jgi:branched-chain amino acid transport system substrate-binding protein